MEIGFVVLLKDGVCEPLGWGRSDDYNDFGKLLSLFIEEQRKKKDFKETYLYKTSTFVGKIGAFLAQ